MGEFAGKVAVVTGAGSGIGQALAIQLARRGAAVAISDIDPEGLAATEHVLRELGASFKVDRLDVADRQGVLAYADNVVEHFGTAHQIYNNAGVGFTGDLEVVDFEEIERVIDINYWGVVHGTKAFLPHLIDSGDGHVVNMSSTAGILAVAGQGAYASAKFAVRGFTEALRQEMALANHPVSVTCVHPGGVKTGIARNSGVAAGIDAAEFARFFDQRLARTTADDAAQIILRGVLKQRSRVLVGTDARLLDALARLTGSGYQRLMVAIVSKLLPNIH